MKNGVWLILALMAWGAGFLGGYSLSAATGTEPGYFDAVEAAGYGGGGEEKVEGIDDEMQEYYRSLEEAQE